MAEEEAKKQSSLVLWLIRAECASELPYYFYISILNRANSNPGPYFSLTAF